MRGNEELAIPINSALGTNAYMDSGIITAESSTYTDMSGLSEEKQENRMTS